MQKCLQLIFYRAVLEQAELDKHFYGMKHECDTTKLLTLKNVTAILMKRMTQSTY